MCGPEITSEITIKFFCSNSSSVTNRIEPSRAKLVREQLGSFTALITLNNRTQVFKYINLWYTSLRDTYRYILLMNLLAKIGLKVLSLRTAQTQPITLQ